MRNAAPLASARGAASFSSQRHKTGRMYAALYSRPRSSSGAPWRHPSWLRIWPPAARPRAAVLLGITPGATPHLSWRRWQMSRPC